MPRWRKIPRNSDNLILMIKKYKHIPFDLDRTLVHTVPEYRNKIIPYIVEKLGGHLKEIHSVDKFWFKSGRDQMIRNEFNLDPEIFWDLFRKVDTPSERSKHTTAYPDAEKAIKKLKKEKNMNLISKAIQLAQFTRFFK